MDLSKQQLTTNFDPKFRTGGSLDEAVVLTGAKNTKPYPQHGIKISSYRDL